MTDQGVAEREATARGARLLLTILVVGIGVNLMLIPSAHEGLGRFQPVVGQPRDLGDRLAISGNRLIRGTFLLHHRVAEVVGEGELQLPSVHLLDERLLEIVWQVRITTGADLEVSPELREAVGDDRVVTIVDRSDDVYHLIAGTDDPFCLAREAGDGATWIVGPCALIRGSSG